MGLLLGLLLHLLLLLLLPLLLLLLQLLLLLLLQLLLILLLLQLLLLLQVLLLLLLLLLLQHQLLLLLPLLLLLLFCSRQRLRSTPTKSSEFALERNRRLVCSFHHIVDDSLAEFELHLVQISSWGPPEAEQIIPGFVNRNSTSHGRVRGCEDETQVVL